MYILKFMVTFINYLDLIVNYYVYITVYYCIMETKSMYFTNNYYHNAKQVSRLNINIHFNQNESTKAHPSQLRLSQFSSPESLRMSFRGAHNPKDRWRIWSRLLASSGK